LNKSTTLNESAGHLSYLSLALSRQTSMTEARDRSLFNNFSIPKGLEKTFMPISRKCHWLALLLFSINLKSVPKS